MVRSSFRYWELDEALETQVREISSNYPITMVNSLHPHRIEGQKSAAFEICDWLGELRSITLSPSETRKHNGILGRLQSLQDAGKIKISPR